MARSKPHWEHFEHGADIGVAGFGWSLAAAFEQAALALTAVVSDPAAVRPEQPVEIRCEETDAELLLVDWLNAVAYAMATKGMLFSRFDVVLEGPALHARLWGEAVDPERHQPAVEVKGATYTELEVTERQDGVWVARTVVDV